MNSSHFLPVARTWLGALLLTFATMTQAAGLGEAGGRIVLGQPLQLRIPLIGLEGATVADSCVLVQPAQGSIVDISLASTSVRVDRGVIVLSSRFPVAQPILSFQVRLACGFDTVREYHLLPQLPQLAPEAMSAAANNPPSVALPESAKSGAAVATPVAGRHVVAQPTTLRLMSRQRHPDNAKARVEFIRRVAAANPEVFSSIAVAYDQPLATGTALRIPEAPARVAAPAPRPRPREQAGGKGRLVIGTEMPATRKVAELEADVERLANIMNDQVQVQIAMVQRLKAMEADIELAKRAFVEQQATNRRLEEQLREMREEQRKSSYIQIVLMILVGGFAVAVALMWRGRARASQREDAEITYQPAQMAHRPPAQKAELQSIFDDLLPPK